MLVRSRMTRDIITVEPAASLARALLLMHEHRIRHLPVVAGEDLVGLLSDRDIRLAAPPPGSVVEGERQRFLESRRADDVMVREVVTTTADTPVEEAARVMAQHRIGALPVVSGERLVGMLTTADLLRAFVELFGVNRPSSRIEVRMPNRPGELARVVRLIGVDARLNISGIVLAGSQGSHATAVLRVQTVDPRGVIESLRRLGYQVGWPALDMAPPSLDPHEGPGSVAGPNSRHATDPAR